MAVNIVKEAFCVHSKKTPTGVNEKSAVINIDLICKRQEHSLTELLLKTCSWMSSIAKTSDY